MGWSSAYDEKAFETLVHRYGAGIKGYALRMLSNAPAAEDVFAETFVRLAQQTEQTWRPGSVRAWLYTVAHRLSIDELRRRKRMVANAASVRILQRSRAWTPNPEAAAVLGDQAKELEKVIAALQPRHREVLLRKPRLRPSRRASAPV